jgi:serine/threonine-protein kinase
MVTLIVAVSASAAGWWFGSGPGGIVTIPELANRTIAQANSALNPIGARVTQARENSASVLSGLVIRTEPAAGSWLWRGADVKLFISIGPKMVRVPSLKGKNLVEATATLSASGFKLGKTTESFNPAGVGTIFDYTASDGSQIAEGSKIDLSISLGALPSLAGVSLDNATTALKSLGITVSKTTQVFSDSIPIGAVVGIAQPDGPLGKGGKVELQISKGTDAVTMPNLVGETISASIALLQQLKLEVIIDTNALRKNWGIVLVKSTSAPAGSVLRIGDSVTIRAR